MTRTFAPRTLGGPDAAAVDAGSILVSAGGDYTPVATGDVRLGTTFGDNSGETGTLVVTGGSGVTQSDIDAIVAGVTAVQPRIKSSAAGEYAALKAGDTWTQAWTVASATKFTLSIKVDEKDDDNDALVLIDSTTGLIRFAGAAVAVADNDRASLVHSSGTLTATLHSDFSKLLTDGVTRSLTVKSLNNGSDTSFVNDAQLPITRSGVEEVTPE